VDNYLFQKKYFRDFECDNEVKYHFRDLNKNRKNRKYVDDR
jgi:hypothetical protein